METVTLILILLVCAIGTGAAVDLWAFMIGDPHHEGAVNEGRIFSKVGTYLLRKFNEFERASEAIVREQMKDQIARAIKRWNAKHPDEPFPTDHPVMGRTIAERVNWWKVTGICPRCTLVWAAMASFAVVFACVHVYAGVPLYALPGVVPYVGLASLGLSWAQGAQGRE